MPDVSFIILRCLSILSGISVFLIWAGTGIIIIGFLYSLIKNIWILLKTNKKIDKFLLRDYGLSALLIDDGSLCFAFTAGLFYPKIYISRGLLDSLTKDELKAVFVHELHHKRKMDPLKFFISSIIRDMFFYIPVSKHLLKIFHAIKEKAADDRVISVTHKPFELASAILKVSTHNSGLQMSVSIKGKGLVEDRIKRLVGEDASEMVMPPFKTILTSIFMVIFLLSIPFMGAYGFDKRCDDNRCKVTHHHKIGSDCNPVAGDMDCNKHCYMKEVM